MTSFSKFQKSSITDLPEEILEDIFRRLPMKMVGRCMCVKKQWLSLVRTPMFIASTTMINLQINKSWIFWNVEGNFDMYSDSENFEFQRSLGIYEYDDTIASSNGLLCISKLNGTIVLWNPVIGKMLALPKPPNFSPSSYVNISRQFLGFDFDSVTDDYKLVRIDMIGIPSGPDTYSMVHVFSLKNYSWKIVSERARKYHFRCGSPSLPIINGAFHWIHFVKFGSHRNIVGFNLNTEVFQEIELPNGLNNKSLELVIHDQSSIGIFSIDVAENIHMWVMKEYANVESWSKLWTFSGTPGPMTHSWPLGIRYNGEVLWCATLYDELTYYIDGHRDEILTISTDTKRGENKEIKLINESIQAAYFEESLMLLDDDRATNVLEWNIDS